MGTISQVAPPPEEEIFGTPGPQESEAPEDPIENDSESQEQVASLIRQYASREKMIRRLEVLDASLQRFYNKGYQHIWWNDAAGMFAVASGSSSVSFVNGDNSTNMPRYMESYNIYGPYGRISSSVLTQNPPGVNFEPDDPSKTVDIDAAKSAEGFRKFVDHVNNRKSLQAQIASRFWTDGRTVTYTRMEKMPTKLGDPNAKAPLIESFGVLESKVPLTAKCREDFSYCILLDDIAIECAKDLYPDVADKIQGGTTSLGESSYERLARLGALQGTGRKEQPGEVYKYLVTRHRVWLRPAAFNMLPDDQRDKFKQLYPNGGLFIFCGDVYCTSCQESMDDHIVVRHPMPGDGMNRPSLGKDCVSLQDAVNDYKNQEKEYYDYGIAATWADSKLVDNPAVREQISQPGNRYSVPLGGPQDSMGRHFFTEPPASCPPGLVQAYQDMRGAFAQFVLASPPAIFGASDEHNETATGISMLRDQAMGQMGMPWASMQEIFAEAYEQAVKCAAQEMSGQTVTVQGAGKRSLTEIAIDDIAHGNFHCIPDTDSNFPETWGSKRQTWFQFLDMTTKNPGLAEVVQQPDNLEALSEVSGIDIVIPGAEARNKQLYEIEELLKSVPVPPSPQEQQQFQKMEQQAQAAGQPPPPPPQPQPSVPIDQIFDLHQFEFLKCQEWLNSQERRDIEQSNPQGVENVRLHALQHYQVLQQQSQEAAQSKQKPPSISLSVNAKDLPQPEGMVQAAEKVGIQLNPNQGMEQANAGNASGGPQ